MTTALQLSVCTIVLFPLQSGVVEVYVPQPFFIISSRIEKSRDSDHLDEIVTLVQYHNGMS